MNKNFKIGSLFRMIDAFEYDLLKINDIGIICDDGSNWNTLFVKKNRDNEVFRTLINNKITYINILYIEILI